jgi:hypothetical protein
MQAYQWFLLGMMVAWTPGLLALALMLRRHNIDNNWSKQRRQLSIR